MYRCLRLTERRCGLSSNSISDANVPIGVFLFLCRVVHPSLSAHGDLLRFAPRSPHPSPRRAHLRATGAQCSAARACAGAGVLVPERRRVRVRVFACNVCVECAVV
eukprot:1856887-Pleurochrysis_carterae.AAC.1